MKRNFHKAGTQVNVCPRCLCSTAKHPGELWRRDGCEKSRENNPIKVNVCEKNQPLAVFLHFSPEVPTRHSLYTTAKEKKKFISRIFALKKIKANSVDFLQFLGLFIFHSKLRGGILFYIVYTDVCRVLRLFWRVW